MGLSKRMSTLNKEEQKEFDYNINLEIINDLTPETCKKKRDLNKKIILYHAKE